MKNVVRLGTRFAKLCFAAVAPTRKTEFPGSRFPNGVWEPGEAGLRFSSFRLCPFAFRLLSRGHLSKKCRFSILEATRGSGKIGKSGGISGMVQRRVTLFIMNTRPVTSLNPY